ncbi:MAG: dTMP kinase [Lentisphaeria bacterium]|nr:dTMP kinase [Lentisphaeria bacterium]
MSGHQNIPPRGHFITFEGPEGAGKSTQIAWLRQDLEAQGITCLCTREPGGTAFAEEMRRLLKHWQNPDEPVLPLSELLLLAAARAQHVETVIRPALLAGKTVLCDRFSDSTFAYQGAGRKLPEELLRTVDAAAVGDCIPDLTLLLDLPVEVGFARAGSRAATAGNYDRFEEEDRAFHEAVRAAFLARAAAEPARFRVIDAAVSPEAVRQQIREAVHERFA